MTDDLAEFARRLFGRPDPDAEADHASEQPPPDDDNRAFVRTLFTPHD